MDVRCERCKAQYVFDDEQVTSSGLTVKCTNCGHVFRVKKKELVVTVAVKPGDVEGTPLLATAAALRQRGGRAPVPSMPPVRAAGQPPPVRPPEWRVRVAGGEIFTFCELTTLQKWIVEQRVSRDDELSLGEDEWKRLGTIEELASFFQVVDAATGQPPRAAPVASGHLAVHEVDLGPDAGPAPARKGSRAGVWLALALLLAVAGAAGAAYLLGAGPFRKAPPPPPPVVTAPPPPPPRVEPPPPPPPPEVAPVPAPEPVPEPVAKPVAQPPAPLGPKMLLAQARKLRERGDLEGALDLYGRVVTLDPESADALSGRGLCYLDLGRYAPAEASFEAALQVERRNPDALLGLAEAYRYGGKKADAIRQYERYLAEHPAGEEADVARNAIEQLGK